ncbi:MAG: bifunctional oligoribonuclease/PAP phosphatase NrnA [Spirochaetales bacterium]
MQDIIKLIEGSKRVAVFTHINPDGDALGSSIAMKLGLEQLGKEVDLYSADTNIHENYNFLNIEEYYVEHENQNYDLAIMVDCPELKRIGSYMGLYSSIPKKIVLDHHLNNTVKADKKIVDEKAGSVGVIIYRLFEKLGIKYSRNLATAIYTSVASDTGCFMHSNTTIESHLIAANMFKYGIDIDKINFYLFKRKTKNQIMLLSKALESLQFHEDNQIALVVIDREDFKKAKANYIDTIGISSLVGGIDNINVAAILTEMDENVFTLSLRCNHGADCSAIAREFNGGGHRSAAGCTIRGQKETVVNKVLEVCRRELNLEENK